MLFNRISRTIWYGFAILMLLLLGVAPAVAAPDSGPQAPPYIQGRFGFGLAGTPQNAYDNGLATYLNAGWYWDWSARGVSQIPPLEYAQTIRFKPVVSNGIQVGYTASITGSTLRTTLQAHPGALWFIGNEPDCNAMDNLHSSIYARAYHDMYYLIKRYDSTARVGAGNIVQPTPLRFNYLNKVLQTYQETYGAPLPTDFWSTHSYILCENCYPNNPKPGDEPFAWGACYVPDWPYQYAPDATFYSVYDHWDMEIFTTRLIAFRQWMYDHGYRNHPLYIPEYGALFYDELMVGTLRLDPLDVNRPFMRDTFNWMRTATDPQLGYAYDNHHLVQRWAWFSLDHTDNWIGGKLFVNNQPTYMGTAYHNYTQNLPAHWERQLTLSAEIAPQTSGAPLSVTLHITAVNASDALATTAFAFNLYDTQPTTQALHSQSLAMDCCGDYRALHIPQTLPSGNHEICAAFTASGELPEVRSCLTLASDLQWVSVWSPTVITGTTPFTVPLYARLRNVGALITTSPITVTLFATDPVTRILEQRVIAPLAGGAEILLTSVWSGQTDGLRRFCATAESAASQASACGYGWINPPQQVYLPLTLRRAPGDTP